LRPAGARAGQARADKPAAAKPAADKPAADKPADNMQILRDKVAADKKLVVFRGDDLTESEARRSGRSMSSIRRSSQDQ
jgi:hypothetical protein